MKVCAVCGTASQEHLEECPACGQALPSPSLSATLLLAPVESADTLPPIDLSAAPAVSPPPPPPDPEPGASSLSKTVALPQAPNPAPRPESKFRSTMLGIAAPSFVPPPPPPPAPASPSTPGRSSPPKFGSSTMLGLAPPEFSQLAPPSPSPHANGEAPSNGASEAPPRLKSAQKTMLGVARPGIAPLNPGQAKAEAVSEPPFVPAPSPPPVWFSQPPAAAEGLSPHSHGAPLPYPAAHAPKFTHVAASGSAAPPVSSSKVKPAPRLSTGFALAAVGCAALLTAAVVVLVMLHGRGNVTAKASLDSNGKDLLELSCSECKDESRVTLGSVSAIFRAGRASLALPEPLTVGENRLKLGLSALNGRREELELTVPVEYRVRASTQGLADAKPKVSVLASAVAGTTLIIDGKAQTLDAAHQTRFDLDVEAELTGPETTVKTLERRVSYAVKPPGGPTRAGDVQIRLGVTPLVVDAPGPSITLTSDELTIAGRTAPGSALHVGGEAVTLDAAGRFVKTVTLATAETTLIVRSTLADHAPRLVPVVVHHTADLRRAAATARAAATLDYAALVGDPANSLGKAIALDGSLYDIRRDGYASVLLLDAKNACRPGPCLVKVIYGAGHDGEPGQKLSVFGNVSRFVDGPRTGQKIPEVRADLLLVGGS